MALSIDSTLRELLANADAKAIIDEIIPELTASPGMEMVIGMKMSRIVKIPYAKVSKEMAKELADRLAALNAE